MVSDPPRKTTGLAWGGYILRAGAGVPIDLPREKTQTGLDTLLGPRRNHERASVALPDDTRLVGVPTVPLSTRELEDERDLQDIAALLPRMAEHRIAVAAAIINKFGQHDQDAEVSRRNDR